MCFRRKKPLASSTAGNNDGLIAWGAQVHPARLGAHYAAIGQSDSGKTLTIRMLLRTMLAPRGTLLHRALIYDPKLDFYPVLRGLGIPEDRIHILNPFDTRSSAWDVAADITTHADAEQLAATLLPLEGDKNNPYFTNAPQELLGELIDTLRRRAIKWTLNDLIQLVALGFATEVLEHSTPVARAAVREHLTDNASDTAGNLRSSWRVGIRRFETIAALWARATEPPVSLNRWMDPKAPPSVLLLASVPKMSQSLDSINRTMFQRCSELLLMQPEYPPDHTWFILDEIRVAEELKEFPKTMIKARSKHGHFVLGFQDIHGLRDVYGPDKSEEIMGQCHNVAIYRLSSPQSIDWASDYFGKEERWVPSVGDQQGQYSSSSRNYSLQERATILGSHFRNLRPPSKSFGMEGIFATPHDPPWHVHLRPEFVSHYLLPKTEDEGFILRPPDEQEPAPFTPGLLEALGIRRDPPGQQGLYPSFPET